MLEKFRERYTQGDEKSAAFCWELTALVVDGRGHQGYLCALRG